MAQLYVQGLRRILSMSDYGSISHNNGWICLHMLIYPSICLNMAEYCWISLNIPENAWINCSDYTRVLNMPQYSYNNIIIIQTDVIVLEFFSARFIHPGALLPMKASRAFEVFEWTGECIFKWETTKMKLAKNITKGFSSKNFFV